MLLTVKQGLIIEANSAPASLRSRAPSRSRSRSGRSRSRGRDDSSRLPDLGRSRSRSRARSVSSRERISSVDGKQRSAQTFGSAKSRSPSPDDLSHERVVHGAHKAFDGSVSGDALLEQAQHLLPDLPGEFAIRHHRSGLVVQLDEYNVGRAESLFDTLASKLAGRKDNKHPTANATSGDGKRFRISFAEVQRMRIRKLQCQLVRHIVNIRLSGRESSGWEETLKEYSTITPIFQSLLQAENRSPRSDN